MPAPDSGEKQQKYLLDHEIRGMMSILTTRLAHLQKKPTEGGSASNTLDHDHDHDDDHGGFGVITMAGSNEGASMTGDMSGADDKSKEDKDQGNPPLTTLLNGNFQVVNNSIMIGGSYSANDPGIHLDVEDHDHEQHPSHPTRGHKGKKKAHFGSSKSDDSI
ncbi:uncharacterized protein LOC143545475 [Bidens hawaiensis]|uniref:uncharacterized protein LOC143545475 n=1 Tax=Bidens hawaiensis TaxID=980011 RepID=UPI00404B217A